MRAWFFGERKVNILQIYGGFKGKNVQARMLQSNECLRRMSSTISEIKIGAFPYRNRTRLSSGIRNAPEELRCLNFVVPPDSYRDA